MCFARLPFSKLVFWLNACRNVSDWSRSSHSKLENFQKFVCRSEIRFYKVPFITSCGCPHASILSILGMRNHCQKDESSMAKMLWFGSTYFNLVCPYFCLTSLWNPFDTWTAFKLSFPLRMREVSILRISWENFNNFMFVCFPSCAIHLLPAQTFCFILPCLGW